MVIMHLVQTGKVETKTGRVLYEVHLPTESGRTKKVGRLLSLEDAGRAAMENEKTLGWDKLAPIKYEIAPPDPAVMAQMAERKKAETSKKGAAAEAGASASEGQAGGSRARAQPKASERSPRAVVAKKPDPIVAAARRKRFP
ncbi:hypothetical protein PAPPERLAPAPP_03400 [Brevundimonas phage vB_BpoS-Papperlapapp]|uniref:Uncharacterized protein n=1 Tax=Brevundimonas phage vB_BpoS-Domovoi TaxID=2948598 RepID=A0A9E7SKN6_9CAUD|nr:hypothetical protein DOMOVOI_02350 [Brevundimonas phage vB_BpoS-Domovoi]USN16081.1 hypothetical protein PAPPERLAPAPP_03400 [Brevundimonas phage vB_BpoS-Papperlapapp]